MNDKEKDEEIQKIVIVTIEEVQAACDIKHTIKRLKTYTTTKNQTEAATVVKTE